VKAHARMYAISGLVFAGLFVAALVLVHTAPSLSDSDAAYSSFYSGDSSGDLVTLGLYIVPFAGIAFLWHMAAIRTMIGTLPRTGRIEVRRTLQTASGVLFVAMLFVGTSLVGAVALLRVFSDNPAPSADVARGLSSAGYGDMFVYGVRAAGMFLLTTTALARTVGIASTPVAVINYVAGAFLLVSTTFHPAILLIFPGWVAVMSVLALIRAGRLETEPAHA